MSERIGHSEHRVEERGPATNPAYPVSFDTRRIVLKYTREHFLRFYKIPNIVIDDDVRFYPKLTEDEDCKFL